MNECPHCYCRKVDVEGKPHIACCMCEVRKLVVQQASVTTAGGFGRF